MWNNDKHNKVWLHYVKNIISSDIQSARFLAAYQRYTKMNKTYVPFIEIIDLNKYKIIKDKEKVRKTLEKRKDKPFVFIIGKN